MMWSSAAGALGARPGARPPAAWTPATRPDGEPRDGAHVTEITDALELAGYPEGSRVIVRREPLHPGAQHTR